MPKTDAWIHLAVFISLKQVSGPHEAESQNKPDIEEHAGRALLTSSGGGKRIQVTLRGSWSLRDSGVMMGARHREPSRAEQGPDLDLGDDFWVSI